MTVQEKIDIVRNVLKQKIREIEIDLTLPIGTGKAREGKTIHLKQLKECLHFLDKISKSKKVIKLLSIIIK